MTDLGFKLSTCMALSLFIFLAIAPVSSGIRVSGAVFEEEVAPGQYVSHKTMVRLSDTESPVDVLFEVVGFGLGLNGEYLKIDADRDISPYTARSFLRVFPKRVHLEPGVWQEILLEGNIPTDAKGGRYAIMDIQPRPKPSNATVSTNIVIYVPVWLTISGTELIKTGEIREVNISRDEQVIDVLVLFENTGNYHYKALAEVVLSDKDGNTLAHTSTSLTFIPIIPTTTRLLKLSLSPNAELLPGTYYVNATVNLKDGTALACNETAFDVSS